MLNEPENEKAPDVAPSEAEPKTTEAIDNPHIAQASSTGNRLVTLRTAEGQSWTYRGKRGRVLAMLASADNGVTQWDTLPWHTRLGGSIHAMRQDGLSIVTEIEGKYRHARYRLATAGCLLIQPKNREGGQ